VCRIDQSSEGHEFFLKLTLPISQRGLLGKKLVARALQCGETLAIFFRGRDATLPFWNFRLMALNFVTQRVVNVFSLCQTITHGLQLGQLFRVESVLSFELRYLLPL